MNILCSGTLYTINDKYIDYSPYLKTLRDTTVYVDKQGNNHVLDADPECFKEYISFLQGEDFHMDETIYDLFDYMGHTNYMEYPLDYWKVKLRDNWIRDNFYKYELWRDPYYGLKEVPVVNPINLNIKEYGGTTEELFRSLISEDEDPYETFKKIDTIYIAGGSALFMVGGSPKYDDIDVFTTNKEEAEIWIKTICSDIITQYKDVISTVSLDLVKTIQLICRLYKSPAEVIYGFDVDCCGFLYDGNKLWATERALYSLRNKVNWFDPSRMSPSYIHRLCKYLRRGYEIRVPHLNDSMINTDVMLSHWIYMREHLENMRGYYTLARHAPKVSIPKRISTLSSYSEILHNKTLVNKYEQLVAKMHNIKNSTVWSGYVNNRRKLKTIARDFKYPRDKVSTLILAVFYDFYPQIDIKSDYDSRTRCTPEWKIQNPMEQLTGSFEPTPILDIGDYLEWFKRSPFIHGHDPSLYIKKDTPTESS